jgi:hypothetical protein
MEGKYGEAREASSSSLHSSSISFFILLTQQFPILFLEINQYKEKIKIKNIMNIATVQHQHHQHQLRIRFQISMIPIQIHKFQSLFWLFLAFLNFIFPFKIFINLDQPRSTNLGWDFCKILPKSNCRCLIIHLNPNYSPLPSLCDLSLISAIDVINSNLFLYQTPQNLRELNHVYNDGGSRGSSRSNNEVMLLKYEPLSFSLSSNKNNQNQMSVHHP